MAEIVYLGYDNPNTITVNDSDGNAFDFSSVTRMVCILEDDAGTTFDTAVDATLIDFSLGSGQVQFNFQDANVVPGNYKARLIEYDPVHTDGQALFHEDDDEDYALRFKFLSNS